MGQSRLSSVSREGELQPNKEEEKAAGGLKRKRPTLSGSGAREDCLEEYSV